MVGVMVEFPYHASSGIPVLNYKLATEGQEGNTKLKEKCSILTLVLKFYSAPSDFLLPATFQECLLY